MSDPSPRKPSLLSQRSLGFLGRSVDSVEIPKAYIPVLYSNIRSFRMGSDVIKYEGVSKSFRTGRLQRELQIVQLSATGCSCIAIL
jgi:hypothetical protein